MESDYNAGVRFLRFLLYLIYATYLTYAGLLFLVVPWSPIWTNVLMGLRPGFITDLLGMPVFRGVVSAFGLLHFLLALVEMKADRRDEKT